MSTLDTYRLLGASGLRVSPLCLGTMTFGPMGTDEAEARRQVDLYAERGGNFLDTANMYGKGVSEEFVAGAVAGRRERFVIATKFSQIGREQYAGAAGNSRSALAHSLDGSLKRLKTDYIDLYFVHVWEGRTPTEEMMRALDDAVRAGKILYLAISNCPAWKVAEANTLARLRGWTPFIAYQGQYNLVERSAERDIIPMGIDHGVTLIPYSPLAGGVLSGRYTVADATGDANPEGSRKAMLQRTGAFNARNMAIADAVREIAAATNHTPSQVAIAWLLTRPGRPLPVLGARTATQLEDNLGALTVTLAPEHVQRLEEVSAFDLGYPHALLANPRFVRAMADGGMKIEGGYR